MLDSATITVQVVTSEDKQDIKMLKETGPQKIRSSLELERNFAHNRLSRRLWSIVGVCGIMLGIIFFVGLLIGTFFGIGLLATGKLPASICEGVLTPNSYYISPFVLVSNCVTETPSKFFSKPTLCKNLDSKNCFDATDVAYNKQVAGLSLLVVCAPLLITAIVSITTFILKR